MVCATQAPTSAAATPRLRWGSSPGRSVMSVQMGTWNRSAASVGRVPRAQRRAYMAHAAPAPINVSVLRTPRTGTGPAARVISVQRARPRASGPEGCVRYAFPASADRFAPHRASLRSNAVDTVSVADRPHQRGRLRHPYVSVTGQPPKGTGPGIRAVGVHLATLTVQPVAALPCASPQQPAVDTVRARCRPEARRRVGAMLTPRVGTTQRWPNPAPQRGAAYVTMITWDPTAGLSKPECLHARRRRVVPTVPAKLMETARAMMMLRVDIGKGHGVIDASQTPRAACIPERSASSVYLGIGARRARSSVRTQCAVDVVRARATADSVSVATAQASLPHHKHRLKSMFRTSMPPRHVPPALRATMARYATSTATRLRRATVTVRVKRRRGNELALFGQRPACVWWSTRELNVQLGYNFRVRVNAENITVLPGRVLATDDAMDTACSSRDPIAAQVVQAPAAVRNLNAMLRAPTMIGHCDGVVLDSGSSSISSPRVSRTYSVDSVVDTSTPDNVPFDSTSTVVVALRSFLLEAASTQPDPTQPLNVTSTVLPAGTGTTFRLTLRDEFTGITSSETTMVSKRAAVSFGPQLTPLSPKVVHLRTRSNRLELSVRGTFDTCGTPTPDGSLQYQWSALRLVTSSATAPLDLSALAASSHVVGVTSGTLIVLPASLDAATDYVFTVRVTDPNGSTTATTFNVTTGTSDLYAYVPNVTAPLTSSASSASLRPFRVSCNCYDADDLAVVGAKYTWTCADTSSSLACPLPLLATLVKATAENVPYVVLDILQETTTSSRIVPGWAYGVQVTYSHAPTLRSVTKVAYVTFQVPSSSGPELLEVNVLVPRVMRRSQRLTLTANVTEPTSKTLSSLPPSYTWSCPAPCSLNLLNRAVAPAGNNQRSLAISANTLEPNFTYTFMVVVEYRGRTIASGEARAVIRVRSAPSGGALLATPLIAPALSNVLLSAPSWIGEKDALPLSYQFSMMDEEGTELMLSGASTSPTTTARVPQTYGAEACLVYRVTVTDALGVSTVSELPAVLETAEGSAAAAFVHSAEASLAFTQRTDDVANSLALMVAVASTGSAVGPTLYAQSLSALRSRDTLQTDLSGQAAYSLAGLTAGTSEETIRDNADIVTRIAAGTLTAEDGDGGADVPPSDDILRNVATVGGSVAISLAATDATPKSISQLGKIRGNVGLMELVGAAAMRGSVDAEIRTLQTLNMSVGCSQRSDVPSNDDDNVSSVSPLKARAPSAARGTRLCTAVWPTDIFRSVSTASPSRINTTSSVVSITMTPTSSSSQQPSTINITFDIAVDRMTPSPRCAYFDYSSLAYSTRGCIALRTTGQYVTCLCTHLTDFAIVEESLSLHQPTVYMDFGNFADIKVGGIIYVSVLTGLIALGVVVGYVVDQRRQRHYLDKYYTNLLAVSNMRKRMMEITSGVSTFPRTFAECAHTPGAKIQPDTASNMFGARRILRTAVSFHPWLAPFTSSTSSTFTVSQRMWLLAVLVMSAMMFNGMFYSSDDASYGARATQVLMALLCVTASSVLIAMSVTYFFARTSRTHYDARNWYVPDDYVHRQNAASEVEAGSTASVLASRHVHEARDIDDPVGMNEFELGEVAKGFLANGQGLLYVSTAVATIVHEPPAQADDTIAVLRRRSSLCHRRSLATVHQRSNKPISFDAYLKDEEEVCAAEPYGTIASCDDADAEVLTSELKNETDVAQCNLDPPMPTAAAQVTDIPEVLSQDGGSDDSGDVAIDMQPVSFDVDGFAPNNVADDERVDGEGDDSVLVRTSDAADVDKTILQNAVVRALCEILELPSVNLQDPFFTKFATPRDDNANKDEPIIPSEALYTLWSLDTQRCIWRLAVEAVRLREYRLAECLFDLALLTENPDMYFVLYAAVPPANLRDALDMVIGSTRAMRTMSVARAWAQFYAAVHLSVSSDDYTLELCKCEVPTTTTLSVLLGLHHERFGCVPYSLAEEEMTSM
eukprot:PhM_4_TR10049/c0_g1_i1/m.99369